MENSETLQAAKELKAKLFKEIEKEYPSCCEKHKFVLAMTAGTAIVTSAIKMLDSEEAREGMLNHVITTIKGQINE